MTDMVITKISDVKVGDKVRAKHSSGLKGFPDAQKDYIKGRVYTVTGIKNNMLFTDNDNGWSIIMFDLVVEGPKVKEYEIGKKYIKDHPDYQKEKYALTCVAYNEREAIFQHKNGAYIGLNSLKLRLIPLPEKKSGTVWVNVYETFSVTYHNKDNAEKYKSQGRLACVEVSWVEGQGL